MDDRETPPNLRIGPGAQPPADPIRSGDAFDPDALLDEARERIREREDPKRELKRTARRLVVALVLIVILAVVSFGVLPALGMTLPTWVPILTFAAIGAGALLNASPET